MTARVVHVARGAGGCCACCTPEHCTGRIRRFISSDPACRLAGHTMCGCGLGEDNLPQVCSASVESNSVSHTQFPKCLAVPT
ncbi:hypothetical protein WJX79_008714 [Trebouxia sp. C0005]